MSHSVKVFEAACKGCVNCLKSCPTEAIRVVNGAIRILPELCIDCGECPEDLRQEGPRAGGGTTGRSSGPIPRRSLAADPTFFAQFSAYWHPSMVLEALKDWGMELIMDQAAQAFDLSAYAVARALEMSSREHLPLISTYCPLGGAAHPGALSRTAGAPGAGWTIPWTSWGSCGARRRDGRIR